MVQDFVHQQYYYISTVFIHVNLVHPYTSHLSTYIYIYMLFLIFLWTCVQDMYHPYILHWLRIESASTLTSHFIKFQRLACEVDQRWSGQIQQQNSFRQLSRVTGKPLTWLPVNREERDPRLTFRPRWKAKILWDIRRTHETTWKYNIRIYIYIHIFIYIYIYIYVYIYMYII